MTMSTTTTTTTTTVEPPQLIDNASALREAIRQLRAVSAVALDTEFIRTDTFYPLLGLVQLSDGFSTWLIDPLAMSTEELAPLVELLLDRGVVKVIHSCSEDMEVLRHTLGVVPTPIFDTQVAAAFAGLGFSLSYLALVKELTGVTLDKHETRSDWLRRPLSAAQLIYAAEDVEHLLMVYEKLTTRLDLLGRLDWLREDMQAVQQGAAAEAPGEEYFLRVKGAWKLDRQGMAILKMLATWREGEARKLDRPRSRIVADKDLLQIAILKPRQRTLLVANKDLHPRSVRVYGDKLIELTLTALSADPAVFPEVLPKPVPREYGSILKVCRKMVQEKADALGLAPEILARRVDLEHLLRTVADGAARLPPALAQGWRKHIIGDDLLAYVSHLEAHRG